MCRPKWVAQCLCVVVLAAVLVACSADAPAPNDNNLSEASSAPAVTMASASEAGCDAERAFKVFEQCKVCHSVERDAVNLTGPNLYGIVGRPAASLGGFAYSKVLRESGIVWDANTLEAFLSRPLEYLPNNRMAFGGVTNTEDRQAIICLLTTLG